MHIWGTCTYDLVVFKVILGSFSAFVSKTAGCRVKKTEIWDSRTLVTHMGYIWPCMVQGHFGVIWCTCPKMACNSKTAGRGVNVTEWNLGLRGTSNTYMGHLSYIGSSYIAIRHKPNLFQHGKWPSDHQGPWASCFFFPLTWDPSLCSKPQPVYSIEMDTLNGTLAICE